MLSVHFLTPALASTLPQPPPRGFGEGREEEIGHHVRRGRGPRAQPCGGSQRLQGPGDTF